MGKPNVIFVFADQWRAQATGYCGNKNVSTPNIDSLTDESVWFVNAISGIPVCSPYRASLLTGQRPLTHGVFVNDVYLQPNSSSIAHTFATAGYDTAYIGKWHIDGHGRSVYIPEERRQGFDYWKVLECTHDYNHSAYFDGDCEKIKYWDGYDAIAQTNDAENYIRSHSKNNKPFFLMLSWGPPHSPYDTAPEKYKKMYNPEDIVLRQNVPKETEKESRNWLAGYYAHCSALDDCVGSLLKTIRDCDIEEDTVFVFTSDHGDLLGSHGYQKKQQPWDEAICVPLLIKFPGMKNWSPSKSDVLIDAHDIMPTLLGLCDIPIPNSVEGTDFSKHIQGESTTGGEAAIISCPHPFGQWSKSFGGREYRGIKTKRYTYCRDLNGPWLLFDNKTDPFQLNNLVDKPEKKNLLKSLDELLTVKLKEANDDFLPGNEYIEKWGYEVDEDGTVPYTL